MRWGVSDGGGRTRDIPFSLSIVGGVLNLDAVVPTF